MTRVLVTGSADGLGRANADALLAAGHNVIVHVRNQQRASSVTDLLDRGGELLIADLSIRDEVREAADGLDGGDPIDAVIHNAGMERGAEVMPVNVVAPYLFTALLHTPTRHIYLSSGMHRGGRPSVEGIDWDGARGAGSYSDSKLFVTTLSAAIADRWSPGVLANAVDPGWVPTKMGGAGAPDDFDLGHETQERLATDPDLRISGGYWYHGVQQRPHPAVDDREFQGRLLDALAEATGVELPRRGEGEGIAR